MSVRARAKLNARGVTVLSVTELRAMLRLRSNPNRRPRDDSDSNDEQRNQRPRLIDQELDNVLVEHQADEAMARLQAEQQRADLIRDHPEYTPEAMARLQADIHQNQRLRMGW